MSCSWMVSKVGRGTTPILKINLYSSKVVFMLHFHWMVGANSLNSNYAIQVQTNKPSWPAQPVNLPNSPYLNNRWSRSHHSKAPWNLTQRWSEPSPYNVRATSFNSWLSSGLAGYPIFMSLSRWVITTCSNASRTCTIISSSMFSEPSRAQKWISERFHTLSSRRKTPKIWRVRSDRSLLSIKTKTIEGSLL